MNRAARRASQKQGKPTTIATMHKDNFQPEKYRAEIKALRDKLISSLQRLGINGIGVNGGDCMYWAASAYYILSKHYPRRFALTACSFVQFDFDPDLEDGIVLSGECPAETGIGGGSEASYHAMLMDKSHKYVLDYSLAGMPALVNSVGGKWNRPEQPPLLYYGPAKDATARTKGVVSYFDHIQIDPKVCCDHFALTLEFIENGFQPVYRAKATVCVKDDNGQWSTLRPNATKE